ncbi:MAG: 30S ribosomal protein S6 [Planctomycetota bacterium]
MPWPEEVCRTQKYEARKSTQVVKYYEGMFLTHNKEARKETDYLAEHVKELIEKAGGEIAQMARWDERRLAYPVKGVTHGVYYLTYFTGDAGTDSRLRSGVRLSNLILRHLTLKLDKLPEGAIETAIELQNRLSADERGPGESEDDPNDDSGPDHHHREAPVRAGVAAPRVARAKTGTMDVVASAFEAGEPDEDAPVTEAPGDGDET